MRRTKQPAKPENAAIDGLAVDADTEKSTAVTDRFARGRNLPKEIGGQSGPEPTRYGDWEKNGRCSDF